MSHEPVVQPSTVPVDGQAGGTATRPSLTEVDIREELRFRPRRRRSYSEEDAAAGLAMEMARNPQNMLQKLAEIALKLCDAETAGVSLLEADVFRWEAVAGLFASHRNDTLPRHGSPCGVCIDEDATQLMYLPDRIFPALRTVPRFVETLLLPFHSGGKPVGTVWVVMHSEGRGFDREDVRVMKMLAHFASAGWQLWKAREEAETVNRRKDEFLAMLSHEIRNPLGAIISASHLLGVSAPGNGVVARSTEVIERQSALLARISDDLLDVSRIGRGVLLLDKTPGTLQAILAAAVEMFRPVLDARGQQLLLDVPLEPIDLIADRARLTQVFGNLLQNAARYSPERSRIWVSAVRQEGEVEVRVRDSGIGIATDQLPGIFEAFARIDGAKSHHVEGLGMGLTIVRRLVELHGGTVRATSYGPDKGSEFVVRFPLRHDATPAGTAPAGR